MSFAFDLQKGNPKHSRIVKLIVQTVLDLGVIASIEEKDWVRVDDDMNNDFTHIPDISHIFERIKVLPTKEGFY